MKEMFVDTVGWVAAADSRDAKGSAVREARIDVRGER